MIMGEVELKELVRFFARNFILFLVVVICVSIYGIIDVLFFPKPIYNSYTTVILSNKNEAVTQNDVILNKSLVETYAEIAKSRRVILQVINALSLDTSYEALCSRIAVNSVNNTEIIKISVEDENPKNARNIANAIAKYFSSQVGYFYSIDNVKILDVAIESSVPCNKGSYKQVMVYMLFGIALATVILLVMFYLKKLVLYVKKTIVVE